MSWLLTLLLSYSYAQTRQSLIQPENFDSKVKQPAEKKEIQERRSSSNLPKAYRYRKFSAVETDGRVILPGTKSGIRFGELRPGDVLEAQILESAIAFPDSKAPIRAIVSSGPLKNSVLLGEASLENNSKRILISFSRFRKENDSITFTLSANALDTKGILGLVGNYQSNETRLFAGEFLAAGAAGYADSTVDRTQNSLGNVVETPSASNYAKKALAAAFTRTSNSISEKLKVAPEYSILEGPIQIKIIITDEPKTN